MDRDLNKTVNFQHLGLIDYKKAWDYQEKLFAEISGIKLDNRKRPEDSQISTPNYLLFCQHPHVYTLGKSGDEKNLLIKGLELKKRKATFYHINRGGDITYHGPGQIVGYPIFDLENFFTDIHRFLRLLEEAIILTLREYDIDAGRIEGLTGVWLDHKKKVKPRKICAIGIKLSRWVTMHGFAFNVNTDLSYFGHIVPCGISDKAVTSISQELNRKIGIREVEIKLKGHLVRLFDMDLVDQKVSV